MKKSFLFIFFSFISLALTGQEILDNIVNFRAEYKFYYKKDPAVKGYYSDVMYLDVCNSGHSMFYSRNTQYRDSLKAAYLADGMDPYSVAEQLRPLAYGEYWVVDKQFKEQKFKISKTVAFKILKSSGQLEIPNWEILGDTASIAGLVCTKAKAMIGGRNWYAWFCNEIPVNDGPWLLWGLPGLILRAEEANGYFKFECLDWGQFENPPQIFLLVTDRSSESQLSIKDYIKADIMSETNLFEFEKLYMGIRSSWGDSLPEKKYISLFAPDFK